MDFFFFIYSNHQHRDHGLKKHVWTQPSGLSLVKILMFSESLKSKDSLDAVYSQKKQ